KEVQQSANHEDYDQRKDEILLNASRLNGAKILTDPPSGVGSSIPKETINERNIEVIANRASDSAGNGSKDMKDAIDEAFVHPFRDEDFREPQRGFDKDHVVDLIKVPLVLEDRDL